MTAPGPHDDRVEETLHLGGTAVDLATRALVVAAVPMPRWGREAEVLAGVEAAAGSGADLVEVPADPRLLGPAAASAAIPVVATVGSAADAAAARAAGAGLLLVPWRRVAGVLSSPAPDPEPRAGQPQAAPVAALVADAGEVVMLREHDMVPAVPIALDALGLDAVDLAIQASLALAVGARLVRTQGIRQARRVVEVMTAVLEARQ